MTRTAIYARLSRDHTGQGESVSDQLADARQLAAARGWRVVGEYVDGSISAATEGKRPQFDALLAAVRAGEVEAIVGRAWDRMTRNRRDDLAFIEACEQHRVNLAFTRGADIDLNTGPGQMVADILSMVARAEIREKSERQKRANQRRASEGRHFGTRRPFGYELDGMTVRESEAEAIRDAYQRILAGDSLRAVARSWNDAGFRTPQKGNLWAGEVVSRTLRTARLAGMREYHGEVIRGDDGEPIATAWPAIVDRDTWYAVQAVLADPARRTTPTHYSQQLLSGVARCAACDSAIQSGGKRKGRARYRCSQKAGHVYRESEPVDEFVERVVLHRLAQPDAAELVRPRGPEVDVAGLRAEANRIHQQADAMAAGVADGAVTVSQLKSFNERAAVRLQAIEAQIPTSAERGALAGLVTARDVRTAWDALSVDARRSAIDALMTVRLVAPGTKEHAYRFEGGQRVVNPETVQITWR